MVLNDLEYITIADNNNNPINCKPFRTRVEVEDINKIYHTTALKTYKRLDLLSLEVYKDPNYQDLLLEFNETPFFEWATSETIIGINPSNVSTLE